MEEIDFSVFKHLWLNISVDVGATTYYSEIAMVQTLDNLRRDGTLNIIEYLERMPDKLITRKQELIESLKKQANLSTSSETLPSSGDGQRPSPPRGGGGTVPTVGEVIPPAGEKRKGGDAVGHVVGSELDAAKKIAQLPTSMQAKYNDLPKMAQRALIK